MLLWPFNLVVISCLPVVPVPVTDVPVCSSGFDARAAAETLIKEMRFSFPEQLLLAKIVQWSETRLAMRMTQKSFAQYRKIHRRL